MNKLPMEFAVEAQKLLQITLEGAVGERYVNRKKKVPQCFLR